MPTVSTIVSLEGQAIRLDFDQQRGTITALHNKLTGEVYPVQGDTFLIEGDGLRIGNGDMHLVDCLRQEQSVVARYHHAALAVTVTYTLGATGHFAEKRLTITSIQDIDVRKLVVSQAAYQIPKLLVMLSYRYQRNITFFARTLLGGLFTGLELPFDTSQAEEHEVTLSYRPNLHVPAETVLASEPAYFGVYRRESEEAVADGNLLYGQYQDFPQPSESEAMLAMVSTILGPPRHGPTAVLSPSCCGGLSCFHSEQTWTKDEQTAQSYRNIYDFTVECGIGIVQDILPWGGEIASLNALREGEAFCHEPWLTSLVEYARSKGLAPIIWGTFTNTEPWSPDGRPFRQDNPDYLITPICAEKDHRCHHSMSNWIWNNSNNCMGSEAYTQWLTQFFLQTLATGDYQGFSIDGDFWGTGGWFTTTNYPVKCLSAQHEHLPGDAQYACWRNMARFLATLRTAHPTAFFWLMRPFMDYGIWSYRHGDAVFTLDECATVENLTHIAHQPSNVTYGDKIRIWSRLRRQRHFCPHYLDQIQLFAEIDGGGVGDSWTSEKLDYVMLSALSSSPNQCYFCGTIDAIPTRDRAIIRRWLDWSRRHAAYLMVHKDLPGQPGKDHVDGTAHVIDNQGFVFLFNPNHQALEITFNMTPQCLGLHGAGACVVTQEYPDTNTQSLTTRFGATVTWTVPATTAMMLHIVPTTFQ